MLAKNVKLVGFAVLATLLVGLGFASGYQWRKAGEVTQARQEAKEAKVQVKQDDAAQRAQALALSDQLAAEQLKSMALERQLQALQHNHTALQREVAHAQLDHVLVPSVAGSCPDPFSGRVFERLYNAAAQAQPPR